MKRVRIILLTVVGLLCLVLGVAGIFLPLLPTTPFVLAAAACLTGTPRLRAYLLKLPLFREYIENYESGAGLPRKTVVKSLIYLWVMLIVSMVWVQRPFVIATETVVGVLVTRHILHLAKPRGKRKVRH